MSDSSNNVWPGAIPRWVVLLGFIGILWTSCLTAYDRHISERVGIQLSRVPTISNEPLEGRILGLSQVPRGARLAVFILVEGEELSWWNKPTWMHPYLDLRPDGTFSGSIYIPGTRDHLAKKVACFLLPEGVVSPIMNNETRGQDLPKWLYGKALAYLVHERKD